MKRAAAPLATPSNLIERLFVGGLVLIFGLIVIHAPLSVFFGVQFGHELLIKAWKELLMGALFILAVVIVSRRREWGRFVRDPFIIISLALAVLYALSLQYGQGFRPYGAGLLIDLRYILYAVLVYVAIRLFPGARPWFIRAGLIGAIVVVGFGLLQFVLPKDFLSVLGYSSANIAPYTTIDNYEGLVRTQSTLRGPNPLGAYAMIVALVAGVVAIRGRVGRKVRTWLIVLAVGALIVLLASYSRSAYGGLVLGVAALAVATVGKRLLTRRFVVVGLVSLAVIVAGLCAIQGTTFYTSVLRHEVEGSGPAVNSDEGHSLSLTDGFANVIKHPFGYGTGSTGSASLLGNNGYIVENQYLYVAHEAGWLALGLFVALVAILLWRAYGQRKDPLAAGVFASGIGLLAIGMLLPVFADDTVSIVWFGLAALVAAGGTHGKRTTK